MGLTYISKNCEIYLGADNSYREDMESLPWIALSRQKSIMPCRRREKGLRGFGGQA